MAKQEEEVKEEEKENIDQNQGKHQVSESTKDRNAISEIANIFLAKIPEEMREKDIKTLEFIKRKMEHDYEAEL